jgi:hypothetical protein
VRLTPGVETTVRRYILGQLEDGLQAELEELLVTDPDAFEMLGVIEDELIEEYLDETGPDQERRALEQHLLSSPEGMRRLRVARALKDRASARPERLPAPTRPVPGWLGLPVGWRGAWVGLAAALAVSLLGNAWLASRYLRHPQTIADSSSQGRPVAVPTSATPIGESEAERKDMAARLQAEQHERSNVGARLALLEQQVRSSAPRIATFALAAGLLRGEGSLPRVSVPADAVLVGLRLELSGDDYPRYRAALLDANGDEIWTASKLKAEGKPEAIVLLLPTGLLPRGDYQVKLSGISKGSEPEAVGTYAFRVSAP